VFFLSDLIREKTGLESDGAALAGQAFGGESPKLKVNKLETESEKDVQKGVEQMLRGLYQAVRNPRMHGKHLDKEGDAEAIVLFINFLVHIIDQSKTPFTKSEFLKQVFDPKFVEKERYAELLASKVPAKYRLEVILDVMRGRENGDCSKLAYFAKALIKILTDEQKSDLCAAISDELKVAESDTAVRTILQIFPSECLTRVEESVRLRTENRLIESIREGSVSLMNGKCINGVFGTWAGVCYEHFLLKDELIDALVGKLSSSSSAEKQAYLFKYFWLVLVYLAMPPPARVVSVVKYQLKNGNKELFDRLIALRDFGGHEAWLEPFAAEIETFKEQQPAADDDVPF
jgi:uncharacterized protein (TIGR02391 family)